MKIVLRALILIILSTAVLNAQTADELFDRGREKFAAGDFDGCVADYRQMVALRPNSAVGHYNLGICHMRLKRYPEATHSLNQAVKNNPKYYSAYVQLGNVLDTVGAYDDAVVAYNNAIKIEPSNSLAYLELGVAHNNAAKYPLAVAAYKSAVRLDPQSVRGNFGLGQTYYNMKDKVQLKRQLDILMAIDQTEGARLQGLLDKLGGPVAKPTPIKPVVKSAQRIADERDVAAMEDFGFDGAVVTAASSIRETATKLGKVLLAVKRGETLSLVNRTPNAGFYSVVEEKSGVEGYIDANSVVIKLTGNAVSGPSLNEDGELENRLADPSVSVRNEETATTLRIRLNGVLHSIPPQTTKTLSLKPGKFTYYGWSPGIRPVSGSSTLVSGKKYSWVFKIYRR